MEATQRHLVDRIIHGFPKFIGKDSTEIRGILAHLTEEYSIKINQKEDDVEDLTDKINIFLQGKIVEGLAVTTLIDYKMELNLFLKFIHKKTHQITSNDIRSYLASQKQVKRSTLNKKLQVLKSFFDWLHVEDIIEKNPAKKIRMPKPEQRINTFFTIKELEQMREGASCFRSRAMLEAFYATGCRLSEIMNMKINDIDMNKLCVNVIGKGNKERTVYFNERALHHMKLYLNSRDDECEYLFVTKRRPFRQMRKHTTQDVLGEIVNNSKVERRICWHDFRRSFASHALGRGVDIVVIQHLLGHASVATTEIYCHLSDERKEYEYRKHMSQ